MVDLMPVDHDPFGDQSQDGLLDQARRQYPALKNYPVGYVNNPGGGHGYMESWSPGEAGTIGRARPQSLPIGQFGIENYSDKSTPNDVAADIVSHHLVNVDPMIKKAYAEFVSSLTPSQNNILQDQYGYAKNNEGETRPFEEWRQTTGLPAYFRGYTFNQWPDGFNSHAYTTEQRKTLDGVRSYLRGEDRPSSLNLIPVDHDPFK